MAPLGGPGSRGIPTGSRSTVECSLDFFCLSLLSKVENCYTARLLFGLLIDIRMYVDVDLCSTNWVEFPKYSPGLL